MIKQVERWLWGAALLLMTSVLLMACETIDFHHRSPSYLEGMSAKKARLLMISSAHTGCEIEELVIRDYFSQDLMVESWKAECQGAVFLCAYAHTHVSCRPKRSPVQPSMVKWFNPAEEPGGS